MKDLVDIFESEVCDNKPWEEEEFLIPTDDIVDCDDFSNWDEYEIPDERFKYED